jgi:long-chain acyl-CoA synthetase
MANHLTAYDGALISGRLPWARMRKMAIAMSGELLREYQHPAAHLPWFQRLSLRVQYILLLLAYQVFPLPRTSGVRQAFHHAGRLADAGYSVLVFPEGRRSESGQLLPFQPGAGLLAHDLHLPVIPIHIDGLHELRQQSRHRARPGELTLHLGPPLSFDDSTSAAAATEAIEQAVRRLCPPR